MATSATFDRLPVEYDLTARRGSTFVFGPVFISADSIPKSLVDCSGKLQVRDDKGKLRFELTTQNSGISFNTASGSFSAIIPATATFACPPFTGSYAMAIAEADHSTSLEWFYGTFTLEDSSLK